MAERVVKANGIDIWTEDFGDPHDPPILLIMGASAQGIVWPDEFCEALAARGRYVIRYDNRDTGQSTCVDFAQQPYSLIDMANDAVGVLDAYGLDSAHLVGASMGGMITQQTAIDHRERVRTMTSIMSTPLGESLMAAMLGQGDAPEGLPGPHQKVVDLIGSMPPPGSGITREERIETALHMWRTLSGSVAAFDEAKQRKLEERILDRATNIDAAQNHQLAVASSPDRLEQLRGLDVKALVIHGTEDPILPYEHGVATAKAIPGAQLLTIDGMGHDLPDAVVPRIVDAIVAHTA